MGYEVKVRRDEEGAWIASVPAVPGCHTYGRSLQQARRRIREALSLWVDDAEAADLAFDVRLPVEARRELSGVKAARERSARAAERAGVATGEAAQLLTVSLGLSRRDAAELLGLSHQRIQQLLEQQST